ncbi:aliphatic sulfonate ABC transporter substrate-binding protein [Cohnella ginsengisoli]|uniref:Aliphatic sulfonate ABC transporter substrate-binding protein n=1 Tax=Cohnella ginsengisoli TaxID=425004 RepID=A0A9X4KCD0_9BACL|nr:aliphatic sulfonate ABC transporter substrate-binding protein [Cohnella ginsengisoli]MDG0789443.1 aliphatic sulfonate ABC transporter substrate-binding protein [Cohnella ginsengisoli]
MRIGFQTIPNTEAVAKGAGWHEKALSGWKVKWVPFDSGRDVNNALASDSIDIGLVGSTLVSTGLSKGIDYEVIWLADVIGDNEALVVKDTSGIQEIGDLVGKTIAVTFGSTTQYSLLGALQASQIDSGKVHIIDMKPADMLAAWNRGDIDGGYVWQPTLQQMQQNGGHVLITSGQLAHKGIVTADVIVVRKSFAESHPEQVKTYLASLNKAVTLFRSHPDEAAAVVAKEFGISHEEALEMMKELIWLSADEQLTSDYLGTPDHQGELWESAGGYGAFPEGAKPDRPGAFSKGIPGCRFFSFIARSCTRSRGEVMKVLELKHISLAYEQGKKTFCALQDINLTIDEGGSS